MKRILEPELMDDPEQAKAYAIADFAQAHQLRVTWFRERFGPVRCERVLDLACGSGDMTLRFARVLPKSRILAVDGSQAMLDLTTRLLEAEPELLPRVQLLCAFLPSDLLPTQTYDLVMCHSALHHFHDPQVLWNTVHAHARSGSIVFVSDLRRVSSVEQAQQIVQERAANEHPTLQRDFAASLCAAFTADEVQAQLSNAGLSRLTVEEIGDMYLLIYGVV